MLIYTKLQNILINLIKLIYINKAYLNKLIKHMCADPVHFHSVLLTYFHRCRFIRQTPGQTRVKTGRTKFRASRNSVRYRRRVRFRHKLSGWHSFVDRCLQVQDTATFNILACNFHDHIPVRLLFIDGRVRPRSVFTKGERGIGRMP